MQQEQPHVHPDEDLHIPSHTQSLIEYLGDTSQHLRVPSPETFKRITRFITTLSADQQTAALRILAQHFLNSMSLHYLDILATFQEKADQEGIDQEEIESTFADVLPEEFQRMLELSQRVSVLSIDDLVTLCNITIGSCRLYRADTAEHAQELMYELPGAYQSQLEREHLLVNIMPRGKVHAVKETPSSIDYTPHNP